MTNETEREEAFAEWWNDNKAGRIPGHTIRVNDVEDTWNAACEWQARAAQPVAQPADLVCDIKPRELSYPLSDYHRAMIEGPLHFTWTDKPHRLVYDLIAAVRYYAAAQPVVPAPSQLELSEQVIDGYIADYTLEGDEGSYTPNEFERVLIKDAFMGLLADAPTAAPAPRIVEALRELVRCGDDENDEARAWVLAWREARAALAEHDAHSVVSTQQPLTNK